MTQNPMLSGDHFRLGTFSSNCSSGMTPTKIAERWDNSWDNNLKLAQMLVKLVEKGAYVLVSSHSPYMIEALKRGVDREDLTHHARFCLAKNRTIEDKDSLSEIFEVLAEPFETFRQMDAEDLRDE